MDVDIRANGDANSVFISPWLSLAYKQNSQFRENTRQLAHAFARVPVNTHFMCQDINYARGGNGALMLAKVGKMCTPGNTRESAPADY
jgi:hypothetical protein